MNHQQYLSQLTLATAGTLAHLGCHVLAATAINNRPWVKARLPEHLSPTARAHLLAVAWHCPAMVEWRN